jgi:hypothetical protein
MRIQGITHLVRGYSYVYTDAGVPIKCFDQGSKRMDIQAERDDRDFGEYRGIPQVGPDVDGYRVYRDIIVGHTIKGKTRNAYGDQLPAMEPRPAGYFIIDTRIDRVYDGLSRHEWLKRLGVFGVACEPTLYKPSIYDKILGRNKPQL